MRKFPLLFELEQLNIVCGDLLAECRDDWRAAELRNIQANIRGAIDVLLSEGDKPFAEEIKADSRPRIAELIDRPDFAGNHEQFKIN